MVLLTGKLHTINKLLPSLSRDEAREASVAGRGHSHSALDVHQVLSSAAVRRAAHSHAVLYLCRCWNAGKRLIN